MADTELSPQEKFINNLIEEKSGSLQDRCTSFAEFIPKCVKTAVENILAKAASNNDVLVIAEAWLKHRLSLKKELQNYKGIVEGNAIILSLIKNALELNKEKNGEGIQELIPNSSYAEKRLKQIEAILKLKKHEFNLYRHLYRYQEQLEKVKPQFESPTKTAVKAILGALLAPKNIIGYSTKTRRFCLSSQLELNLKSSIVSSQLTKILNASAIFGKEKSKKISHYMDIPLLDECVPSDKEELVNLLNLNVEKCALHEEMLPLPDVFLGQVQSFLIKIFKPKNIAAAADQQQALKMLIKYQSENFDIKVNDKIISPDALLHLNPARYKLCIQLIAFIHKPQPGKAVSSFLTRFSPSKEKLDVEAMKTFSLHFLDSLIDGRKKIEDSDFQPNLNKIMREKVSPLYEMIRASGIVRQPSLVEMICP